MCSMYGSGRVSINEDVNVEVWGDLRPLFRVPQEEKVEGVSTMSLSGTLITIWQSPCDF